MSPKNYPRQVHFSPTWNPGSSTTTGATTNTAHSVTSTPGAAQPVTTPVLTTPVVAAPVTPVTTPATTTQPIVVQTSQTQAAAQTVAQVSVASVAKPNTTANVPTFGTKAGTMSSSTISPTSSAVADSSGTNGTTIAIIGGSVVVGVVILACAAVAWLRRRKAKQDRDADNLDFDRHAAMRQSTMIPDDPTPAPSVAPTAQPMIDRHYNTPAVTYGYNVQPSYQGGPPQQAYQSQYAPGQVLFNAPMSGYATPSGYASGYATPGGAPATNLPSTQYAERAYTGPTGQPGSPMEGQQQHQYAEHEPVRRTSAGGYSNMSRGHNSNEFQQQQYADIERSLHGHDDHDAHAPAPASPSPFGDQAQAPPSPRPGMTHQMPPPVHPAVADHHDAAHQAPGAAPAARGGAPAQRPQSTYDDDDAYGGM